MGADQEGIPYVHREQVANAAAGFPVVLAERVDAVAEELVVVGLLAFDLRN